MAFDLPRDVILPVDTVDVRLVKDAHPFELENGAAIAENWTRERAERPALFDGRVVLLSSLELKGSALVGICHEIGFSTFLYWRRLKPVPSAEHAFAHAMLIAADGALVAIRMGPQTANAGKVYFAAGSFEPQDFDAGGQVRLDFNMAREVGEETGLDLAVAERLPGFHVLSTTGGTVIVRRYRMPETADVLADRIRAFVAADPDPEISGPVIIRSADDLPEGLMPHMLPLVRWHFGAA